MKALVDRLANQNLKSAALPVSVTPPKAEPVKVQAAVALTTKSAKAPRQPLERAERIAHTLITALFGASMAKAVRSKELKAEREDPLREERALLRTAHIHDETNQEMIIAMAKVFRVELKWMVDEHAGFKRPVRPVTVIHPHTNIDAEAACMTWLLVRKPELRSRFNIAPDVHVECVKSGELTEEAATPSLEDMPKAFLTSKHLEEYGHLFVDCGGGGGRLDQHGRVENKGRNTVSSLHLLITGALDHIPSLVHLVPLFEQVIDNDLTGERIAQGYNLREFLNGLIELGLSSEEILDYLFVAFDAAEAFLLAKQEEIEEDDATAIDRFREVRKQVLSMETILGNLRVPTDADLQQEADAEVRYLLKEAERSGMPMPADEREQLLAVSLQNGRERAQHIGVFHDRFRAVEQEAKAARQAAWEQANTDWGQAEVRLLNGGNAFVFSKQEMSIPGRPFHGYEGRVGLVIGESGTASFGPCCRYRYGKETRNKLAREHLMGRTVSFDTARKAAHLYAPALISVQLRDVTRGADGKVVSYRFTIAGSGIDLTQVAVAIRDSHAHWLAKEQGATQINNVGVQARSMTARLKGSADTVAVDYLPEFRTVYGNWFKTNQEMPLWTMPVRILLEAIEVGMEASAEVTERRLRERHLHPKRLIAPVYERIDELKSATRAPKQGSSSPAPETKHEDND
ncbi:MAG: hypothetical protein AAB974_03025 [Patescibacteria group bacterium]